MTQTHAHTLTTHRDADSDACDAGRLEDGKLVKCALVSFDQPRVTLCYLEFTPESEAHNSGYRDASRYRTEILAKKL